MYLQREKVTKFCPLDGSVTMLKSQFYAISATLNPALISIASLGGRQTKDMDANH